MLGLGALLTYAILTFCVFVNLNIINDAAIATYGTTADWYSSRQDSFIRWLVYFSPYSEIFVFLVGSCAAAIFMSVKEIPVSKREYKFGCFMLILSLAYVFVMYALMFTKKNYGFLHEFIKFSHWSWGLGLTGIIFCCARYKTSLVFFLTRPVILTLGDASYSLYLLHSLLFALAFSDPSQSIYIQLIRFALLLVLCIVFSVGSYRVVEIPCRSWLRNKFLKKSMGSVRQQEQTQGV